VWPGDTGTQEFNVIVTPHRDSITILQWSQYGGRLVSADTGGSIVGWKIDSKGQLFMMFHHELKESFTQIAFRTISLRPTVDIWYNLKKDKLNCVKRLVIIQVVLQLL